MKILLPTLHVRPSAQATPLAAACLVAALPEPFRSSSRLLNLYLSQSVEQMCREILDRQPDIIAFPLYVWNRLPIVKLTRLLRQQRPDIRLLAGGPEASADSQAVLAEGGFDAVICGEGEEVFADLLKALAAAWPIDNIAGVYCGAGTAPQAVYCEQLDRLPSPYLQQVLRLEPGSGLLWEVARGCPFNCSFCYDAKGQQGVRPLPVARLAEELQLFVASGVEQIWILDSTFNFPAERGRKLLELLLKTAPNIHYHLEAKAEFLDQESVHLLSQLHCSVQVGLQSADPQVLKPLQRAFDPGKLFPRLRLLSDAGIIFGIDLIYGLPSDNHQGFCRSLNAALQAGPNQVDMFPLAVLPGTQLHRDREQLGLQAMPAPPYEILGSPGYPAEELAASRQLAAATDIFYNRGRAVGFCAAVCGLLEVTPVQLMEEFSRWLERQKKHTDEPENWRPDQILPLQQAFLDEMLKQAGCAHLGELLRDLLVYHYHYAETLLGPELPPAETINIRASAWRQCWVTAEHLRLIDFAYELNELLAMGGAGLKQMYKTLSPDGSTGIFLRRGQEVICETLQEDFARLLKESDGSKSPAAILPHCSREEGMELVEFALKEGLLHG